VKKIIATVKNISANLLIIENEFNETTMTVDERYLDVTKLFTDIKVEINQEITEIAEETCRADFHAKASPCCPDCQKAKYRVPPKSECSSAGCDHSCVYQNITCDAGGTRKEPCMFPFKYKGESYSTCTTHSAFGEVKRPWCFLDTQKNREALDGSAGKERRDVGFCDCTEIRCICPKGKRLADDRKSCVAVE